MQILSQLAKVAKVEVSLDYVQYWKMEYMQEIEFTIMFPITSPKCPLRKRKVQFVNDKDLVQIREFEDDEESRQNRQLFWEFFAIDRFRFKDRVYRIEHELGDKIFSAQHRDKIYTERILPYLRKQDEEEQEKSKESVNSESASNPGQDVDTADKPDLSSQDHSCPSDLSCPQDLSCSQNCPPDASKSPIVPSDDELDLEEDTDPDSDLDKMDCQISSHQLTVVLPCPTSTATSTPSLSVSVHPSSSSSSCCLLHILNHA